MRISARALPLHSLATATLLSALVAAHGCGDDSPAKPQAACDMPGAICTMVGTGDRGYDGEGNNPLAVALYFPNEVEFDPEGRLLVLDWNNNRIRRLDADARVRTIIGTGFAGPAEEGALANETAIHHAFGFALDAAGTIYIAGYHQQQILEVGADDRVAIIAGTGVPGFGGDGGPALAAMFNDPTGIAVAPSGRPVFVADANNHRIRMIDEAGNVTTIAGNGTMGYSGDGGPATAAQFNTPFRVAFDATTGNLYVCDTGNSAVRRIDANGTITAFAGTGVSGDSGDGGPAASAQLSSPFDVVVGPEGAVYIADSFNNRVRRVAANGTIDTVAGAAARGFAGDEGQATEAALDRPYGLAFDAEGNLWIADTFNSRIRAVHR